MHKRILIIDDEPYIVDLVQLRLEANGYEVSKAVNGVDGLTIAAKEQPDLVLLDVMMPRKDGLETLTDLKKDPALKKIPIVMFTVKSLESDIEKALKMGAVDYIVKPFDPEELVAKIQKVLT